MGKKFARSITKRTKVKLSPKEAEKIIQEEFVDSRGNKIYTDINVAPHTPSTPTIRIKRQYKKD